MTLETGGFELALTITLVFQANRLNKCASHEYKAIEDIIKNYKNTPVQHYINESYFLYDKSELIKETFITAINKKLSILGSIRK